MKITSAGLLRSHRRTIIDVRVDSRSPLWIPLHSAALSASMVEVGAEIAGHDMMGAVVCSSPTYSPEPFVFVTDFTIEEVF